MNAHVLLWDPVLSMHQNIQLGCMEALQGHYQVYIISNNMSYDAYIMVTSSHQCQSIKLMSKMCVSAIIAKTTHDICCG